LLESSRYVRCVLIDFSKAFDMVDHAILVNKLSSLQITPIIIKWIVLFLSDRTHATRYDCKLSGYASFNRSIVQGSGIGPTLFVIFGSDLKPLDTFNHLLKYADDCTLLTSEQSAVSAEMEMQNVTDWAIANKMTINLLKTVELVFHRPNMDHDILPPPLLNIARVTSAKLLGVHFSSNLKFTDHVASVVAVCNQRLYLLSQLKKQGLGATARDSIFLAIVVSRIMYALPVFYGYLTQKDKNLIQSVFVKATKWQLLLFPPDFDTLVDRAEHNLFQQSLDEDHCLHHIYTPKIKDPDAMVLRKRGHNFVLPSPKSEFNSRTFIVRTLLKYR
jgi:hypothetical protein